MNLNIKAYCTKCDNLRLVDIQPPPAKVNVCVFDIECNCETYGFPCASNELDFIEQIGLVVADVGGVNDRIYIMLSRQNTRNRQSDQIDNFNIELPGPNSSVNTAIVKLECFNGCERSMLLRFREVLIKHHIIHLIAHNGMGFDIPCIIQRAHLLDIEGKILKQNGKLSDKLLGIKEKMLKLSIFDRKHCCDYREREIQNNQLGKYKICEIQGGTIIKPILLALTPCRGTCAPMVEGGPEFSAWMRACPHNVQILISVTIADSYSAICESTILSNHYARN